MLLCMRTTIDIHDDVLLAYKRIAAETRTSLKQVVEDALRAELARRRDAPASSEGGQIVTFKGNGLRQGVSLDNGADLRDIMDSDL